MVKYGLFILMFTGVCFGQMQEFGSGVEVSGFRLPDYDDDNQLRAQLYGERDKVLEKGVVEIFNLKIELYEDGEVAMIVFSPHCFFNVETREAYSDDHVLVESEMLSLVGRGFTWSAAGGRFKILHDSKVLVKKAAQAGMKELKL